MSTRQSIVMQWLRSRLPVSHGRIAASRRFHRCLRVSHRAQRTIRRGPSAVGLRSMRGGVERAQRILPYLPSRRHQVRRHALRKAAADETWHEFILWTREYDYFCQHASAVSSITAGDACGGAAMERWYWRAWSLACAHNESASEHPDSLPLRPGRGTGSCAHARPCRVGAGYRGSAAVSSGAALAPLGGSASSCGSSPRHSIILPAMARQVALRTHPVTTTTALTKVMVGSVWWYSHSGDCNDGHTSGLVAARTPAAGAPTPVVAVILVVAMLVAAVVVAGEEAVVEAAGDAAEAEAERAAP